MKILVLDGNENQAVACVRSLGQAGHTVCVGAETSWSKAGWSKYSKSSFRYISPKVDMEGFIQSLIQEVKKVAGTLVLPMTERTTIPVSAFRDLIFAAGGRLLLPPHETILKAFDKSQTTQLAISLGIPTPKTIKINNLEQAELLSTAILYPVILKPYTSEELAIDGKLTSTGRPVYANNVPEFIDAFKLIRQRASSILVQEYIEGSGTGYFALMCNGQLIAEFAHKRLRDVHPTGSGSSLRESVLPDAVIRNYAIRILKELNWQGVAMVEFRVRSNGEPVFLEVNGRFWNSLPLAIYSGVDFPNLLVKARETIDYNTLNYYKSGIRCRWLVGDFRHLLSVLKGKPKGYRGFYPNRWKTLLNFITPSLNTYHDNFSLTDPLPELGDWLHFILRGVRNLRNLLSSKGKLYGKERYSHS